jgi:hypothetical protein
MNYVDDFDSQWAKSEKEELIPSQNRLKVKEPFQNPAFSTFN